MERIINLNTFPKLNILVDLSYMKHHEGTLSEFEKNLRIGRGNPESREIFKVLREKGILYPTQKKYQFQLYKLNIMELCRLIEHQVFIIKIAKYIDFIH